MFRIAISILIGLGLSSLAWGQPAKVKPAPVSPSVKLTAKASNDFACDIFGELAKENAGKNVFFSPWSISSALAMTMEGARNQTAVEMGQTLRLPKDLRQDSERPWRLDPYHEGFADMQRRSSPPRDRAKEDATRKKVADMRKELFALNAKPKLTNDDHVKAGKLVQVINELEQQVGLPELNIANAVWGEKTYPFDPAYLDAISKHYGKDLAREADFINNYTGEANRINRWVEDQTRNRIKDIIPTKPPGRVRMILVNAIYFKGEWVEPFQKKWTKDGPFTLVDGTKKQMPLMHQQVTGPYAAFNADGSLFDTPQLVSFRKPEKPEKQYPDAGGFQIAELPYKGNKLAMTVILPSDPKGLDAIQKKLTGETLARWLGQLKPWQIQVKLPRFRMETDYGLNGPLQHLGMRQAFLEREADFTGISKSRNPDDNLSISQVLHKAFVEVNEEGTEAAAATAIILVVPISDRSTEPFVPNFFADRPFLFLIREVETGAVLFMGRLTTPTK